MADRPPTHVTAFRWSAKNLPANSWRLRCHQCGAPPECNSGYYLRHLLWLRRFGCTDLDDLMTEDEARDLVRRNPADFDPFTSRGSR
jgi:hypothetical protein